jgi:hypothetical protein
MTDISEALAALDKLESNSQNLISGIFEATIIRSKYLDLINEIKLRDDSMVELAKQLNGYYCPLSVSQNGNIPCLDCQYQNDKESCRTARIEWAMKKAKRWDGVSRACPSCDGTGKTICSPSVGDDYYDHDVACKRCNGTGKIPKE